MSTPRKTTLELFPSIQLFQTFMDASNAGSHPDETNEGRLRRAFEDLDLSKATTGFTDDVEILQALMLKAHAFLVTRTSYNQKPRSNALIFDPEVDRWQSPVNIVSPVGFTITAVNLKDMDFHILSRLTQPENPNHIATIQLTRVTRAAIAEGQDPEHYFYYEGTQYFCEPRKEHFTTQPKPQV